MTNARESLRAALGATPDPEFELTLPRGWERSEPSPEAEAALEKRLSRRFMEHGSPDGMRAFVQLRGMLRQSMTDMRAQHVVAYFAPTGERSDVAFPVPASIVATIRSAPTTEEMDGYVKRLIVSEGARPMEANRSILRFERERIREEKGERIVLSSTVYATPIPGSRRRRALELVAGYGRPEDIPRDDETIRAAHAFLDLMVSTLRWRRPDTVGGGHAG
ncbi:protein TPRXL [Microbacterium excoecariae]|uniref:protein TPRXL n=1 Tax=Microbacterium excoecariae TaxID=2715210 RepID=UPI0014089F8B|nr:protein TPRXL [Microbacterium excoecariae]NHI16038.1 protein TPRXL [Microbacterium excoecariae]